LIVLAENKLLKFHDEHQIPFFEILGPGGPGVADRKRELGYLNGEFTPLSKPLKTKRLAEKARSKNARRSVLAWFESSPKPQNDVGLKHRVCCRKEGRR
jgi:hypothetical protein